MFIKDAKLTDDGSVKNFKKWSNSEFFGKGQGQILSIDKIENDGKTVFAEFKSAELGTFDTFWKFTIENEKISILEVGVVK
ncbi:hypothetical protein [Fluviispira multicolorata]|uniref:Uncharacterized protein n=1 Tax=Fluviispira multicolorata TaxID=2654512 RepID=A0A833JER8_9BACT|nr:hypothetical protein [Fluviispira multicolorata]KAB8030640.1 hypothetical protein GCL57_06600 [Fluviispira multicolorata]